MEPPAKRRVSNGRPAAGEDDRPGFPVPEHHPWTFEGQIEQLGEFSRGMSRRRHGPLRWVGLLVVAAFLLPPIAFAITSLLRLL